MRTIKGSAARGFFIGLAIGQIWLSLISTSCVSILWICGRNPVQVSLILASIGLVGLIPLGASLTLLRSTWRLPAHTSVGGAARSRATGRTIGLRFGLLVLAEVVIIGSIDAVLGQTNHGDWIVPVTCGTVGLHFVPLALLFQVRPYIVLGLLWVFITILTVILTPARLMLGQGMSAWVLFPIAGCGLATWVVTASILRTNIQRVRYVLQLSSPA